MRCGGVANTTCVPLTSVTVNGVVACEVAQKNSRQKKAKEPNQAEMEDLRSLRKTLRQCHTLKICVARNLYVL